MNYENVYVPNESQNNVSHQSLVTMNNRYIKKYKSVIEKFLSTARQIENEKQRISERYQKAILDEENKKLDERLAAEYLKAKESVNTIFEDVRTGLSMGSFPNVESITADRVFFNGHANLDISEKEMQSFVDRYTENGNFVMLRIIAKYIDSANAGLRLEDQRYRTVKDSIHLALDHLRIYKEYADGAISLIETIYKNPKSFSDWALASYAEESFGKHNYLVIGTGNTIPDFKTRKLPESAKHTFDHIGLELYSGKGNMYVNGHVY